MNDHAAPSLSGNLTLGQDRLSFVCLRVLGGWCIWWVPPWNQLV